MSWDPVHDIRRTFRALLDAQCDPGAPQRLPEPHSKEASWCAVLATLLDEGAPTAVLSADAQVSECLTEVGAPLTELSDAEFVVTDQASAADLAAVPTGTALNPELGATVLIDAADGTLCSLGGPGIPEPVIRDVPINPRVLEVRNEACADYPRGFDLVIVGAGSIWAIPRSTRIREVG
ncbi:phosphonate C-P lyase system protein PhnH [Enemella sp. A6]|uniref:phosphonate C-P lyase system protein PhnH n=1 Tax=Enemella sp. A6 TaxID=3440152 RepID=UPI003EC1188F